MPFRDWQPQYAAYGIATFPVGRDKRPLMSHWNKVGIRGSSEIVRKFSNAEGIACVAGPRSRLTVIDIDAKGERELTRVLDQFGRTPLIAQTPSGGHHLYFRWMGEKRKIKPEPSLRVDVLGGGIVILPPTISAKGQYRFIKGCLDDLDHLPHLLGLPANVNGQTRPAAPQDTERIREGARNKNLWKHCMRIARHCDDFDALLDAARTRNAEYSPPLPDDEVLKAATSALGYTERGENRFGRPGVFFDAAQVNELISDDPDLYLLLSFLRANNKPDG